MSKHTPGPWEISNLVRDIKEREIWTVTSNGMIICNVSHRAETQEEDEANAHLIASAPYLYEQNLKLKQEVAELLEATKIGLKNTEYLFDYLGRDEGEWPVVNDIKSIKAAIAAAEGVEDE